MANTGLSEETEKRVRELQDNGYWFWTNEMYRVSTESEFMSELRMTKDLFVQILLKSTPENLIANLSEPRSPLTTGLAIKHAMISTDASAEILDRVRSYVIHRRIRTLHAEIEGQKVDHELKKLWQLSKKRLTNKNIASGDKDLRADLLFLICFGSVTTELGGYLTFRKFNLAQLCGKRQQIEEHFRGLYLEISRQTTQREVAAMGDAANRYVKSILDKYLLQNPAITSVDSRRVLGTGDKAKEKLGGQQFDLVYRIQPPRKGNPIYVIIEVGFQETTNSIIERKASQLELLFPRVNELGHKVCAVVGGAGYLSGRPAALKTIIQNSHLTVALAENELKKLAQYILSLG